MAMILKTGLKRIDDYQKGEKHCLAVLVSPHQDQPLYVSDA